MKTTCSIRKMQESDIQDLSEDLRQGWLGREEILIDILLNKKVGREVFSCRG